MNENIRKILAVGLCLTMVSSTSLLAFAKEMRTDKDAVTGMGIGNPLERPDGEAMPEKPDGEMPQGMTGGERGGKGEMTGGSRFADVEQNAWYAEYADFVSMRGIMNGKDGMFRPAETTTRGEYVLALYNAAGAPEVTQKCSFTDIETESEYADAVSWAEENGIASGAGDGSFMPDAPLTREMAMTFLYRALTALNIIADIPDESVIADFSDNASVSNWAGEAMNTLVNMGIISGTDEGKLNPQGNLVNSEVAAMIYRILGGNGHMGEKPNDAEQGGKGEIPEMTEEEKAERLAELKAELTAKLEAGEITQEEYDSAVTAIEAGDFMPVGRGGGHRNQNPPELPENETDVEE